MEPTATNGANAGCTCEEALRIARVTGESVVPTFCAMCGPSAGCGLYAFTKAGRMTRVLGMREAPRNRGSLCAKGLASAEWLHSPDRLTTPLVRKGARGEGRFQAVSWDEAIGHIADRLLAQKKEYGPESLAMVSPAMRNYNALMNRFLTVHGSPNYGHSGICMVQRSFAFAYTLGTPRPVADADRSDLIVYWGRQPVFADPTADNVRGLVDAKARRARIVAIKPSMEPDAGLADLWIPVRPGTDAALALSMLHVVVGEDRIDHAFVERWCEGYEALKPHVAAYPPEWGERISGVPADRIRELARMYASTPKACIDVGNGLEHAPSANDALRAIAILMAITGHLDRPGGNLLDTGPGVPQPRPLGLPDRYTPEMADKLVAPEFPRAFQPFVEGLSSAYYRILESVLTEKPYPVRAVIAPGTQPTVSTRGTRRVVEALRKIDFFVTVDVTRPAEMDFADVVLPTATTYESDHPFELQKDWLMARRKVVEPLGAYKSIQSFFLDLAVAMGYGADFWGGSVEAMDAFRIAPFGLTVDELRAQPLGMRLPPPAGTKRYENYEATFSRKSQRFSGAPFLPNGKVALYCTEFEKEEFPPLPVWREPPESLTGTPEIARRYPLVLSDYHTSKAFSASWLRNVPSLREIAPEPTVHIHPDAAAARGIRDGDRVRIASPHGWISVKAELYPGIRPDTVMVLHGWWQGVREHGKPDLPLLDGGANVNLLYGVDPATAYDPLITAMSSQTLVEVTKDA